MITKDTINQWIEDELNATNFDKPLSDAIKYVFSTGGKRLRPIMLVQAYLLSGKEITETVKKMAVAVECLHEYTLIHDDLPCMDNDDFRRGQPSCHKKFGEAVALLAGDALLNLAFTLLLNEAESTSINAVKAFSYLTGGSGIIGGQLRELVSDNIQEEIIDIYERKTCYLFWGAVMLGAKLGRLSDVFITGLNRYCFNYGFAFQIYDDLMDLEIGKHNEKSYIGIYGEEQGRNQIKKSVNRAIDALIMSGINSKYFTDLAFSLVK